MKNIIRFLLFAQCFLIGVGVSQIIRGHIWFGLFNVVVNIIFGLLNLDTIKKYK